MLQDPPVKTGIHPTSRCNLKCRMCDTGYKGPGAENLQRNFALRRSPCGDEMSLDKWEEVNKKGILYLPLINMD